MDFKKNIDLLELKPDFTEEELKKSWRKLSQQYHPDNPKNLQSQTLEEAIKKQAEINSAYNFLKLYLKNNKKNTSNQNNNTNNNQKTTDTRNINIELDNYRKQKFNELQLLTNFEIKKYKLSKNIRAIIKKINKSISGFNIATVFRDKTTINYIYDEHLNKIKKYYKELEEEFFMENQLDKNIVKNIIDYKCNLTEFYNQLLKIKENYNKTIMIKQKLEKEILKYQNYTYYEKVNKSIEDIKEKTLKEITNNEIINIQENIDKMHEEIINYFKKYHELKQKTANLKEIIKIIDDPKLSILYQKIIDEIEKNIELKKIEQEIYQLENKINEYLNSKQTNATILQIYKLIIEKYNNAIKENSSYTKELEKLLNKILVLFKKGCEEKKDINYFYLFNKIDFKNYESDSKLVLLISNEIKDNKGKIYVKRKESQMDLGDNESYFYLDDESQVMYRVNQGEINRYKIDSKIIEKEFILLDELLKQSKYVGKYKIDIFKEKIYVIYESNGYLLYQKNNDSEIKIIVNSHMSLYDGKEKNNEEKYKNKKQLYELIVNQIIKNIELNNEKKDIYNNLEPLYLNNSIKKQR